MSYTEKINGITVYSNMPFSGNYPGAWVIDVNFKVPFLDYFEYLNKNFGVSVIKKVYSGSITNYKSYALNPFTWRISFSADSPEIIPLIEVLASVIGVVIALYLINSITVTISKNPVLSTGVSAILLGGAALIGVWIFTKIKGKKQGD
ncbi:MAG: hypothetical protein QXH07_06255 [Thermoplasmata archaeon]